MQSRAGDEDVIAPKDDSLALLTRSPLLQRDSFLVVWLIQSEEQRCRQAVQLAELEERCECSWRFHHRLHLRSSLLRSQSCAAQPDKRAEETAVLTTPPHGLKSTSHPCGVDVRPDTTLCLAEGDDSDATRRTTHASLSVLLTRVRGIEHALAALPASGTPLSFAASAEGARVREYKESARCGLDGCLDRLHCLLYPRSTTAVEPPLPAAQHRYNEPLLHPPLDEVTARQQHVRGVLQLIHDALCSIRDAYAFATHASPSFSSSSSSSTVPLDALLQLPPDTLPLLVRTQTGEASWCQLRHTKSLFALWTALRDSEALFPANMDASVVDTLWAAVVWMYTCELKSPRDVAAAGFVSPPQAAESGTAAEATEAGASREEGGERTPLHGTTQWRAPASPCQDTRRRALSTAERRKDVVFAQNGRVRSTVPQHSPPPLNTIPSSYQKRSEGFPLEGRIPPQPESRVLSKASREDADDERWAYRALPVTRTCTAPTVYDEFFPLPSAVSAFTEPGERLVLGGPGVDFYTGPSRRPRSLL